MPTLILDGRKTRDALLLGLIRKIKGLTFTPTLAIIQVGDRPDSDSYINAKKSFAKKIGVNVKHIELSEDISEQEVIGSIKKLNEDDSVNGIIVQLPLPQDLNRDVVINSINPKKDVDGLTAFNVEKWSKGEKGSILPATARGVFDLLKHYDINLSGKKVCVVGRSALVGTPIAAMCRNNGAIVVVCNSKTADLAEETKKSDILIVAVGKPRLITARHVKAGQIVIDVGINTVAGEKLEDEVAGKKLVGDVDFDSVKDIVAAITPVPGGVGPMTVFALFENLVELC